MISKSIRSALEKLRPACDRLVGAFGFKQSDLKIQKDALSFWENHTAGNYRVNSHWRGHGIFENDDERWLSLGQRHVGIFKRLASTATTPFPTAPSTLEWGCGGGSNAVAFAEMASRFVAVDISKKSIEECLRQMELVGMKNGIGVVADMHYPEKVAKEIDPVDMVLCTYVFELLPTRAYALRLLRVFHELLNPGGLAIVQIRYATAKLSTRGRSWGYKLGFTKMVSFFLDDFWDACAQAGFEPRSIELLPIDKSVFDERYAYFLLEKPALPIKAIA